ncbi:MAG TPA: DUF1214 domain-containing protein [Chitinophagales bacterium]|nr:DUF1214 domain-containing protein [Chitinophagales bacterium]
MKFLKPTLFILLALLCGLGVGVYRIAGIEHSEVFFTNGSWTGSKDLPLGKDKLLTAQASVFALFALPSKEAVYLFARRDEKKELLNSANDYTITGNLNQINAKYWSITAYGKDLYLIPNPAERYSFNNANLVADSAGNFTITVSHVKKGDNWLPAPDNARFNLVLRIYKGDFNFISGLETASLPEIKKLQTP